jgi:hypothetical protein
VLQAASAAAADAAEALAQQVPVRMRHASPLLDGPSTSGRGAQLHTAWRTFASGAPAQPVRPGGSSRQGGGMGRAATERAAAPVGQQPPATAARAGSGAAAGSSGGRPPLSPFEKWYQSFQAAPTVGLTAPIQRPAPEAARRVRSGAADTCPPACGTPAGGQGAGFWRRHSLHCPCAAGVQAPVLRAAP